jgi:hypothetical protein
MMSDSKQHARVYSHTLVLPTSCQLTPALTPANADPTGRAQRAVASLHASDGHYTTQAGEDGNTLVVRSDFLSNLFHYFEKNNEFYFFIHFV